MTSPRFAVLLLLVFVGGCASGPKYTEVSGALAGPAAGQGRIYFYRDGSPFGSAVQPPIKIDGEKVGKSVAGSFFFVDLEPGSYTVSCSTEATRNLSVMLAADEVKYVRTRVSMGAFVGHVSPVLEDEAEAMKTMRKTSYIGSAALESQ